MRINVDDNHYKIDDKNKLIVSHLDKLRATKELESFSHVSISFDGDLFQFDSLPKNINYQHSYHVSHESNNYNLYFTELPIISIQSSIDILDEPKTHAYLTYSDDEQVIISDIGIELRGGFSQTVPKKSFDIEFWKDNTGNETKDVVFQKLRNDDDWILNAQYNQPLRIRSFIANKLWLDMHTLHYKNEESKAKSGADAEFVEMFLNGIYNGIYKISEQVDKKQLQLKNSENDLEGELYKGVIWDNAVLFSGLPDYDIKSKIWGGHEIRYPNYTQNTDWEKLYQFTNFVINSSDDEFSENIWNEFDFENFIDYFIFLNLLGAEDNVGKNIYLAKYESSTAYFYVPWDLDGCFGVRWDGQFSNTEIGILKNRFMERVIELDPKNYALEATKKWSKYRRTILDEAELIGAFEDRYKYFFENRIYERESLVYANYQYSQEDLTRTTDWIKNRISFLDDYFGHTALSATNVVYPKKIFIYPNPTNDKIYLADFKWTANKDYFIYNSSGHLVQSAKLTDQYIALQNLSKGQYLLEIGGRVFKFLIH